MKNIFRIVIPIIGLHIIISSCGTSSNKIEKSEEEINEIVQSAQVFDVNKCEYCSNPWSATSETISTKIRLLGFKAPLDKYGEPGDNIVGWVCFKNVKLIIPPGGKSVSALEIPFYYYAKNCWGNTDREGAVHFIIATSAIDTIIEYSNLGNEYLTQSKEGDLFDVFIKSPDIDIYTPKHACDITYATISNPQDVFIKKLN